MIQQKEILNLVYDLYTFMSVFCSSKLKPMESKLIWTFRIYTCSWIWLVTILFKRAMELSEALKEVVTTHQSSFSNFKLHYVVNPIDQGNYVLSLISVNIDMPYCNDPKVLVCSSSVLLCEFTCMAKKTFTNALLTLCKR